MFIHINIHIYENIPTNVYMYTYTYIHIHTYMYCKKSDQGWGP